MRAQAGQPAESFGLRTQLRMVPLLVWALVGLQLAVLLGYAVLMPVYRAPDEPQNFDIAMATRGFTQFTGDHWAVDPMVTRSYPFAGFVHDNRRAPVDAEPRPPGTSGRPSPCSPGARGSRPRPRPTSNGSTPRCTRPPSGQPSPW